MKGKIGLFLFVITLMTACISRKPPISAPDNSFGKLVFLSEFDIPFNQSFNNTTIGGLSGIDYNAQKDEYYLVSDDRSAINAARFYTAKIRIANGKLDTVIFSAVTSLLQKNGEVYPNSSEDPYHTPDPEALRYNPVNHQFTWSSEGERIVEDSRNILQDPAIIIMDTLGRTIDSFALPAQLQMRADEEGPRRNGVIEGLSFADNYQTLFASVEEPLYTDGPRADVEPNNALIRIIKYDTKTRKPAAQYAYALDAVAYAPNPAGAFKVNGIPDILSIGKNKLLVIERSFSYGRLPSTIKIFIADLGNATDISGIASLVKNPPASLVSKKLLLNMDSLEIYTDNLEGVTFGPVLPNGHKTLLFVSDNNFSKIEITQFLLFEIVPWP